MQGLFSLGRMRVGGAGAGGGGCERDGGGGDDEAAAAARSTRHKLAAEEMGEARDVY
jgi:hypothetical protein